MVAGNPAIVDSRTFDVLSRLAAAVLGGYAVAYSVTGVLAWALPVTLPAKAYLSAMLCFPVLAATIIWSFTARSTAGAWAGLLAVALPATLVLVAVWP